MDFKTELAKWGYNKGNSIDVQVLIEEVLPSLFSQQEIMYSEDDMKSFARQFYRDIKMDKSNLLWDELADKCLEQFKKIK